MIQSKVNSQCTHKIYASKFSGSIVIKFQQQIFKRNRFIDFNSVPVSSWTTTLMVLKAALSTESQVCPFNTQKSFFDAIQRVQKKKKKKTLLCVCPGVWMMSGCDTDFHSATNRGPAWPLNLFALRTHTQREIKGTNVRLQFYQGSQSIIQSTRVYPVILYSNV